MTDESELASYKKEVIALRELLFHKDAEIEELKRRLAIAKDYLDSDWFPHKSRAGTTRTIARKALL